MNFFGIGIGEVLLILIIGLIILGPGKLIDLAQSLGRLSHNLKKMSSDFTSTVNKEMGFQGKEPEKTHHKVQNTAGEASAANSPKDSENNETTGK
jgi:Sec-independent protein translocase protein TatA